MAGEKTLSEALQHGADDCEKVAQAVREISAAATRVLSGPLTVDALCVLIREALPRGYKSSIPTDTIRVVLVTAANVGGFAVKAVR